MTTLAHAHDELFKRMPDECFDSFEALCNHCDAQKQNSRGLWEPWENLTLSHDLTICAANDGAELALNDWSFSRLCGLAGVQKSTVDRLSLKTASKVFDETLARDGKPLQILSTDDVIRAMHGTTYTRLWNS